jgi:hypothetical protein
MTWNVQIYSEINPSKTKIRRASDILETAGALSNPTKSVSRRAPSRKREMAH